MLQGFARKHLWLMVTLITLLGVVIACLTCWLLNEFIGRIPVAVFVGVLCADQMGMQYLDWVRRSD